MAKVTLSNGIDPNNFKDIKVESEEEARYKIINSQVNNFLKDVNDKYSTGNENPEVPPISAKLKNAKSFDSNISVNLKTNSFSILKGKDRSDKQAAFEKGVGDAVNEVIKAKNVTNKWVNSKVVNSVLDSSIRATDLFRQGTTASLDFWNYTTDVWDRIWDDKKEGWDFWKGEWRPLENYYTGEFVSEDWKHNADFIVLEEPILKSKTNETSIGLKVGDSKLTFQSVKVVGESEETADLKELDPRRKFEDTKVVWTENLGWAVEYTSIVDNSQVSTFHISDHQDPKKLNNAIGNFSKDVIAERSAGIEDVFVGNYINKVYEDVNKFGDVFLKMYSSKAANLSSFIAEYKFKNEAKNVPFHKVNFRYQGIDLPEQKKDTFSVRYGPTGFKAVRPPMGSQSNTFTIKVLLSRDLNEFFNFAENVGFGYLKDGKLNLNYITSANHGDDLNYATLYLRMKPNVWQSKIGTAGFNVQQYTRRFNEDGNVVEMLDEDKKMPTWVFERFKVRRIEFPLNFEFNSFKPAELTITCTALYVYPKFD